jgi:hypothetical protein
MCFRRLGPGVKLGRSPRDREVVVIDPVVRVVLDCILEIADGLGALALPQAAEASDLVRLGAN